MVAVVRPAVAAAEDARTPPGATAPAVVPAGAATAASAAECGVSPWGVAAGVPAAATDDGVGVQPVRGPSRHTDYK